MTISVVPKEFLSAEECKALFQKISSMARGGITTVTIKSKWTGSSRWARNRMHVASDVRDTFIFITRVMKGAVGYSRTTCMDDDGLLQCVRDAETATYFLSESAEQIQDRYIDEPHLNPKLWSEETYGFGADQRTDLVQNLIGGAEDAGFTSAGNLQVSGEGTAVISSEGMVRYYPQTWVECSMTVRNTKAQASGWAGVNHYDLAKINPKDLAARALDKCKRSMNPVSKEPGRYTVIMEPQATADLFGPIASMLSRQFAEMGAGPFAKEPGRSKINDQVLDRRLIMRADPMDPEGGFLPYRTDSGTPFRPVDWIDQGILRELSYEKGYALANLNLDRALPDSGSFRLMPAPGVPTTTVEDMIAKTELGILVTRFSNLEVIDERSVLCAGYTRDGLWLIEGGKITKPIKNFRFNESPLFVLNNLEDIGVPQRVFAPGKAWLAPAVRVRDFSFTYAADAV